MGTIKDSVRLLAGSSAHYTVRLAGSAEELKSAQALRFQVFNLELNEGLPQSHATGLDSDAFDAVCDHLLVEHLPTQQIVGTYRLQMGTAAKKNLGYYSEQEFDFTPFEPFRHEIVELGRACVEKQHRNLIVLGLLWKGIADYATDRGGRYLIGCSSLTSQDPGEGAAAYAELSKKYLPEPAWRTVPLPAYACPVVPPTTVEIPKLLRAYLTVGAKICGPPALDRQFKTIDFLTLMDLATMSQKTRERYFS
jgi:putative hemolysin